MTDFRRKYNQMCEKKGDINEHLPTLYNYAKKCDSILELGVRGVVSSWAFMSGLMDNGNTVKRLFVNDIERCDIGELNASCVDNNVYLYSIWINCLEMNVMGMNVDMTFIDTWHVYPQLKCELLKFSAITNKYIIMHDTEVDGIHGESVRNNWDLEKQSRESGFSVPDLRKGLGYAIDEFIAENKEWVLEEVFTNNNGLTVLRKL